MISPQDAFQSVVTSCSPLPPREMPLAEAVGLRLREDIRTDRDYPPFPRATMDGFAVRLADAGKDVPIAGELQAGFEWTKSWLEGTCLEIMTGAACPPDVEAVVAKEYARCDGDKIVLPLEITRGMNIAPQGSECRAGKIVLSSGQTLTPMAIAVAAAVGRTHVWANPQPRLAIIITGEELAHESEILPGAKIHDSNGPMLVAMARSTGLPTPKIVRVRDKETEIYSVLERFADCDIIVLSGGVSAGNYDLVPRVVQDWGGEASFIMCGKSPANHCFSRGGKSN